MVECFLPPAIMGESSVVACQINKGMLSSNHNSASLSAVSSADGKGKVTAAEQGEDFVNPSIAAKLPRQFEWWNDSCDVYLDKLEEDVCVRFVAFHDEAPNSNDDNDNDNGSDEVATNNWLHVTSSSPKRRVQYEMRYVEDTHTLAGIVRFGVDCEGPPGYVHGGAMATVADAVTATAAFQASQKWGFTTNLNCNYREMLPLSTAVKVEAKVVLLKKRKASVEWSVSSLVDNEDDPQAVVRHAFGTADFLFPRQESLQ